MSKTLQAIEAALTDYAKAACCDRAGAEIALSKQVAGFTCLAEYATIARRMADERMAEHAEESARYAAVKTLAPGLHTCGKCSGKGKLIAFSHYADGVCFWCDGTGKVEV